MNIYRIIHHNLSIDHVVKLYVITEDNKSFYNFLKHGYLEEEFSYKIFEVLFSKSTDQYFRSPHKNIRVEKIKENATNDDIELLKKITDYKIITYTPKKDIIKTSIFQCDIFKEVIEKINKDNNLYIHIIKLPDFRLDFSKEFHEDKPVELRRILEFYNLDNIEDINKFTVKKFKSEIIVNDSQVLLDIDRKLYKPYEINNIILEEGNYGHIHVFDHKNIIISDKFRYPFYINKDDFLNFTS